MKFFKISNGSFYYSFEIKKKIFIKSKCETFFEKKNPHIEYSLKREHLHYFDYFKIFHRLCYFVCINIPTVVFLPTIYLFPSLTTNYFLNYLYWSTSKCGPVIIKLGQWIGTRPDIFSETLIKWFSKFQNKAPQHSWKDTELILNKTWPKCRNVLHFLDINKPLGSGCMTQVYKAKLKISSTKTDMVAVKVIHPTVREQLKIDLTMIKLVHYIIIYFPFLNSCSMWTGIKTGK